MAAPSPNLQREQKSIRRNYNTYMLSEDLVEVLKYTYRRKRTNGATQNARRIEFIVGRR